MSVILFLSTTAYATDRQVGGPPDQFYSGMPNVARVYYKFCLAGVCHEKEPRIWGQLCTVDHDRAAEKIRPQHHRFVSWRCVVDGPVVGGIPTSGKAKP